MKIAFFVSSVGDTDLALQTIRVLQQKGPHEIVIISLTKVAQQRVDNFQSLPLVTKNTLPEILQLNPNLFSDSPLTEQQIDRVGQYVQSQMIDYAYFGVPSVTIDAPFQLAKSLNIPSLMAYEFMFKPEHHCLWNHLPALSKKTNVKWAVPLVTAKEDFPVSPENIYITGHLSIDNAYSTKVIDVRSIKQTLQASNESSLAFISSTTQPVDVDAVFLDCLLTELKNHPNMQVRLGLHPGIQDFDVYLQKILDIYRKHAATTTQFKIILPDTIVSRIKAPELSIDEPMLRNVFLRININGAEASAAGDRITQAVPGALLNQALLEGKAVYSHSGMPYLPRDYFSNSIASFFKAQQQPPRLKKDLGLDEKTAPEHYAEIILNTRSFKTAL